MILKSQSKLGYSVSLYYLHKFFCGFSLTPWGGEKKGNALCLNDSDYTFLEGIMKCSLKCTLDIQPKHMNLL